MQSAADLTKIRERWSRHGGWLAAAVGVLCFLNTLPNDFVYDDIAIVRENARLRSPAGVVEIWRSDWWQPHDPDAEPAARQRDRLYRPLTMTTFAANYAVGGAAPWGYHAINVLLHALACALVWRFGCKLLGDAAAATLAALLFAVHPVHVEAVAGIVGRAELLAAVFLLGGLLLLLPTDRAPGAPRAAAAGAMFLAAVFSKETGVCYPAVALVVLHAAARRPAANVRRWWCLHVLFLLLPLAIYLPIRYLASEHHLLRDVPPPGLMNPLVWGSWPQRWLHALTILGHYARLLIAPGQLCCNYGLAVIDPQRGPELLTLVGGVAVVSGAVALAGYRRRAGLWRQLAVLTAMSIASYALISNAVLLIGVSLAERLMYWPSVPVLLAVGAALTQLWRRGVAAGWFSAAAARGLRAGGVALLVALALRTGVRNADWASNLRLFERDVRTYPQCVPLRVAMGRTILTLVRTSQAGDDAAAMLQTADRHLAAALEIYPGAWSAVQTRGKVLALLGQREQAIACLELAARLNLWDLSSRELLAELYAGEEPADARLSELAAQVESQPADVARRLAYVNALLQTGRFRAALEHARQAVELDPENPRALRLLGDAYAGLNLVDQALAALRAALARDPDNWQIHLNLSTLLAPRQPADALHHAQQARRLSGDHLEARLALAQALVLNERVPEALHLYRQVARELPAGDPLHTVVTAFIRDLQAGRR